MAIIIGTVNNDRLFADPALLNQDFYRTIDGKEGDDILYAGRGINTLTGGTGSDTFIIGRTPGGTGSTDITTITDFDSTTDFLSLIDLAFSDVTITAQGSDSLIKDIATGQTLAIVKNIAPAALTAAQFKALNSLSLSPEETSKLVASGGKVADVIGGVRIVEYADYDKRPGYYLSSALYTTLAGERETSNKFVAFDFSDPASPYGTFLNGRVGPLQHTHRNEYEAFFVVSGTYIFTEGMQMGVNMGELREVEVKAGTLAFGPQGRIHGFRSKPDDGPGKIFSLALPAGLDQFFINAGTAVTNRYDPIKPNSQEEAIRTAFWAGQRGDALFLQGYDLGNPNSAQLRPPSSAPSIAGQPIPTFRPDWPDMITTSMTATNRPISTGAFGEQRLSLVSAQEVKAVTGRVAWKGPFVPPNLPGATMNYDSIILTAGLNSDFSKIDTVASSVTDPNNPDPFTSYRIIYTLDSGISLKIGNEAPVVLDALTYVEIPTGVSFSLGNTGSTDLRALDIYVYNAPIPPPSTLTADLAKSQLVINGDPITTNLTFTVTGKNIAEGVVHEIGVFAVDADGKIDGIAPGEAGYMEAALRSAKVILTSISENFAGIHGASTLRGFKGNNLAFVLVQNGTIHDVLNNRGYTNNNGSPAQVFFGSPGSSTNNSLRVQDLGGGKFQLGFEDYLGSEDFQDIVLTAEVSNTNPNLGTFNWILAQQQLGLLDLTYDIDGSDLMGKLVDIEVADVNRKAAFNHVFGFYQVEDEMGTIRDPLTGQFITATAANKQSYIQAAINLTQQTASGFNLSDQNPTAVEGFKTRLAGGKLYAPILISNGSIDDFLSKNPTNVANNPLTDPLAFVPFVDINSDALLHNRSLGNNTWGFEDLFGGGDHDFNDLVVHLHITSPSTAMAPMVM